MAEQQRREMNTKVFCIPSEKRALVSVPSFHNGRAFPITSVSASCSDCGGYQTDAMGGEKERERERESQGEGRCLGRAKPPNLPVIRTMP